MQARRVLAAVLVWGWWIAASESMASKSAAQAPPRAMTQGTQGAVWTTWGTNSGPIPNVQRHEPANLLSVGSERIMIDAGDGATEQLAKAGMPLASLQVLVLTHLHFDHTGGLFAVISERYQTGAPGVLNIYGPPGTKAMVDDLLAAMKPAPPFGFTSPAKEVKVIEVNGGTTFSVGAVKVTAVRNSHYNLIEDARGFVSLSYRFDLPHGSIAFTGDTGPSKAVENLSKGVDLLVSEIIDPEHALAAIKRSRPDLSKVELFAIKQHFEHEHLTLDQAGLLAQRAGAKRLVLTHNSMPPEQSASMQSGIAAHYKGPIAFARDLDAFAVGQ